MSVYNFMEVKMNIHNMTPHVVTLIVEGVRVDYPSEGIIRATQKDVKVDEVVTDLKIGEAGSAGFTIPVFSSSFGAPEGVPENLDGIYIVSSLAFQSLKAAGYDMSHFVVPSGTIRDEQGRIIGCKGFARI